MQNNRKNTNPITLAIVLLIMTTIIAVPVSARTIKLLAVAESGGQTKGALAELSLEIKPGEGRVFLETFPLTQIATQVSMRFAKQVACAELDKDCSVYDFFYTIRSPPGIIGGPSAGAAATALTVAELENLEINESIGITGTINSGGIIGPVGGIEQKVQAANETGIKEVLVPKGGGVKGPIPVTEIFTLKQAVKKLTGYDMAETEDELTIDPQYAILMKNISKQLCERTNTTLNKEEKELMERALQAENESKYYSSASYCFRAGVSARTRTQGNISTAEKIKELTQKKQELEQWLGSQEIKTITHLQAYLAVKERIQETEETITEKPEELAYSEERLVSAKTWGQFFSTTGKERIVDQARIVQSCQNKIEEAEERRAYVSQYLPADLVLDPVKPTDNTMCLLEASKAKANADVLLSTMGVKEENLKELIDEKIKAAKKSIMRAQKKGEFPILGYSYYEYATMLKDHDPGSALLFAEYSLELSNIDIYFEKKVVPITGLHSTEIAPMDAENFVFGLGAGIVLSAIFILITKKHY